MGKHLIINGKKIPTDLDVTTWEDDDRLKHSSSDGRRRKTRWVRNIIGHTIRGIPGGRNHTPQFVKPGGKDLGIDYSIAEMWFNSPRSASAHLIVDGDGSIGQLGDLYSWASYHAGSMNETSIGIEMNQDKDAGLWEVTLDVTAQLIKQLCIEFGIQMQYHWPYKRGPIRRLVKGGKDCVGFFGHRDATNNRGQGDPGDFILEKLKELGFESYNFGIEEDKQIWMERQEEVGVLPDGVPGPQTVQALKEHGYKHGIYALGKVEEDEEVPPTFKDLLCKALGC